VPEQTLFPGAAIVVLAIVGALGPPYSRRLRAGLVLGVLACLVLSLGFNEHGSNAFHPYKLLFDHLPGWKGIRVPGRLTTLTSLGLALLAAAGAQHAMARVARPRPWRPDRRGASVVGVVLVAAVLIEGSGFDPGDGLRGPSHPAVPKPVAAFAYLPKPQLHLPATTPDNRRYVLWSTDGFPDLVNGRGSFDPASFEDLVAAMKGFPDRRTIGRLRDVGVRSVVFHPELASDYERRRALFPLPPSLEVKRSTTGGLIVYELGSR